MTKPDEVSELLLCPLCEWNATKTGADRRYARCQNGDCAMSEIAIPIEKWNLRTDRARGQEPMAWRECPNQECRINCCCGWPDDCDVPKAREAIKALNASPPQPEQPAARAGKFVPDDLFSEMMMSIPARREPGSIYQRLAKLLAAAPLQESEKDGTCSWSEDGDGGPWATRCGNYFSVNDGLPSENGMKFCCYCGGTLIESKDDEK